MTIAEHIPLHVFRVYFNPGCGQSRAEFELVALPFRTPADVRRALSAGAHLRGLKLQGWPAPGDKRVRLIFRTWLMQIRAEDVRDVEECQYFCAFRPSGGDTQEGI